MRTAPTLSKAMAAGRKPRLTLFALGGINVNVKEKLKTMEAIEAANRKHVADWKRAQSPKIRGVLIDPDGDAAVMVLDKKLDAYYEALDCRCIDIVRRTIGGRLFDIICDDESLLVDKPQPSAISPLGEIMMCGKLFVVQFDGKEDVQSLTDEEIVHVFSNVVKLRMRKHSKTYTVTALARVDYH